MTSTIDIQIGDLTDERVLRLLTDHLDDMFATSPAESVHALDVSGPVSYTHLTLPTICSV